MDIINLFDKDVTINAVLYILSEKGDSEEYIDYITQSMELESSLRQ